MYYSIYNSKLCEILLAGDETGLKICELNTADNRRGVEIAPEWIRSDSFFRDVRHQLEEYFAGTRKTFTLKLNPGGTEFQKRVWNELKKIPYGETRSYGEIASAIGQPAASRAVGAANGRNPLSLIVPCHRVIGSGGRLTGYAHGLNAKAYLLDFEQEHF